MRNNDEKLRERRADFELFQANNALLGDRTRRAYRHADVMDINIMTQGNKTIELSSHERAGRILFSITRGKTNAEA